MQESGRNGLTTKKGRENGEGGRDGLAYSCLLKNELLGASIEDVKGQCDERRALVPVEGMNLFQVQKNCAHVHVCVCAHAHAHVHGFFHTVTELAVTVMFKLITCI
jgi:hypothetical protein